MKVCELGEFALIDLFNTIVGPPGEEVVAGIGDDAAVWRDTAQMHIATTDTLVESVHFTLGKMSWRDLGWKALAVNLSDVAAMGGVPKYALVSLGVPGHVEVDDLKHLYQGMTEVARQFQVSIVGGDVVSAPVIMLTVALTGTATTILTRSAARPHDQVAVTGLLGASAAGLRILQEGLHLDEEAMTCLIAAHVKPYPRTAEGQILTANGVKAAIDISDGLVGDLVHLCKASRVGARLFAHQVPVHPTVRRAFGEDALNLALSGGEDYELLFTSPMDVVTKVSGLMPCPVTVIGEITSGEPGRVRLFDRHGDEMALKRQGWQHFGQPHDEKRYQ